jgi:hypothetical protein
LLDNVPPRPSLSIIILGAAILGNGIVSLGMILALYYNKAIGQGMHGHPLPIIFQTVGVHAFHALWMSTLFGTRDSSRNEEGAT